MNETTKGDLIVLASVIAAELQKNCDKDTLAAIKIFIELLNHNLSYC